MNFTDNTCNQYGGAISLVNAELDAISSGITYSNNIANANAFTNNLHSQVPDEYSDIDNTLQFNITKELIAVKNVYDSIYPQTDDLYPFTPNNVICYVKQSNSGTKDGSSWTNAHIKLQNCLDDLSVTGGEIWVETGTYTPSRVPDWKIAVGKTQSKHKSFILYPNIRLYGGFAGTETSREQRDFAKNPTHLSCQITATLQCSEIMMAEDNTIVDGFIFIDSGLGSTRRRLANSISVAEVLSSTSTQPGAGIWSNSTNIIVANSIFYKLFSGGKGK